MKYRKATKFEIAQLFMLLVAIIIGVFILKILKEYKQIENIYQGIAEDVIETEDTGFPINIDKLLKVNKNIVGWIQFPKKGGLSNINYPIVHSTSEAEDRFYLHHTVDKKYNFGGCIFTASWETGNFKDVTDDNTIIYGHAMDNRTMFGGLKLLREQGFYKKNKNFYIYTTEKKIYRYHIIAVYETEDGSAAYTYIFADAASYDNHIGESMKASEVKTKLGEQAKPKHMVTLSTCNNRTNTGRIVVAAVREKELSYEEWKGEFKGK